MIEVSEFEEVTRIKMSLGVEGKPLYWVAAYLVDGLLIDTGSAHTASELVGSWRDSGWRWSSIRITTRTISAPIDSSRNASASRFWRTPTRSGARGVVPELNPYQEYVWGYPEPSETQPLGEVVETPRFRFEVIETGGHSEGHVVLFERDKGWCFSGDVFITEKPKVIRADEEAAGLIASMRQLAALPSERLVLFTSMGMIIPDGREVLLSCADYLEGLGREIASLADEGLSAVEIRERIFGEGSSLAALTGGHFSTDNLVGSLLELVRPPASG